MAERRVLTADELAHELSNGSHLRDLDPEEPMEINGFEDLVAAVKSLATAQREAAEAELARNRTQLEVLSTLQGLIRGGTKSQPVDITPLKTVLSEIVQSNVERGMQAYEFQIQRDGNGFISNIKAIPTSVPTRPGPYT